jgi:RNA polymerase sigma-70 factor (ECF subfamily)
VSGWEDRLQHPGRNAEELMEEREFATLVDSQLQRLSGVERTVLVLYHQEERTYEQIALALGLPIGTVRTHLHRGRKKLREGIEAARSLGDRAAAGKEAAWKSSE